MQSFDPNPARISPRTAEWPTWAAAALIVAGGLAGYANGFSGPFLFDDAPSIANNPTIRHLWPLSSVLHPPSNGSLTVAGRPLVNLSFAINYALSGTRVGSYHALNVLIHLLAGLTLFGIARSSFRSGFAPAADQGPAATRFAFAVALLWTVHPLQTESVAYIVQRAESLMGLFYLLTLYCFIRGAGGNPAWYPASIACCLLGMACKEVMVSAPIIVLLYDRTFISGTFRAAWRRHWRVYSGLAATWLFLALLMLQTGNRGSSAGFGLGISGWSYALTQCRAIVLYLKLSIWPHPLVLDYGTDATATLANVWPQALLLIGLLAGTIWGLVRRPVFGFLGAWFFLILAPTSSFVPVVTQTAAEHRMYLSLAALITLAVLAIFRLPARRSLPTVIALGAVLGGLTVLRNRAYRSEIAIWTDEVSQLPGNFRGHHNLGVALAQLHQSAQAIAQYREALRLLPDDAEAHNNLGVALADLPGRLPEAIAQYQEALRLKPNFAQAYNNLGLALARIPGRLPDAIAQYDAALRLKPDLAEAHNNLGMLLAPQPGRQLDAIAQFNQALRLLPNSPEVHYNLALVYAATGRMDDAIRLLEIALRLDPSYSRASDKLARFRALQTPDVKPRVRPVDRSGTVR